MILHHRGFPIRISADITLIYNSPQLIAVNRVLLRLLMPRHSPYALVRLNFLLLFVLFWIVWVSLEHGYLLFVKRHWLPSFECFHLHNFLCGEIVVITLNIGKTLNFDWSRYLMSSISVRFNSFLFSYSIFNERNPNQGSLLAWPSALPTGRSGWTRTIDLALIRRAL